jgi:hypothetical protein
VTPDSISILSFVFIFFRYRLLIQSIRDSSRFAQIQSSGPEFALSNDKGNGLLYAWV